MYVIVLQTLLIHGLAVFDSQKKHIMCNFINGIPNVKGTIMKATRKFLSCISNSG